MVLKSFASFVRNWKKTVTEVTSYIVSDVIVGAAAAQVTEIHFIFVQSFLILFRK